MAKQNYCSIFVALLCTFLINRVISSPILKKSIESGSYKCLHKDHLQQRRSVDPEIEDLPIKLRTDDAEVIKYAEMAVNKYGSPTFPNMKAIIVEIEEATSYPPSGKLLYTIKLKIGITKCRKESDEQNCEYNSEAGYDNCVIEVFRESDKNPSWLIRCQRIGRRRRAVDKQPKIADQPIIKSVDDPEVKKHAEKALREYAKRPSIVNEPVLIEIKEATFYPPAGKLLYKIKMEIGTSKCPKGNRDPNLNCEYKAGAEHDTCTVIVWRETGEEPSMTIECTKVDRKRRETGHSGHVMDKPMKMSLDQPEIKKYAQKGVEIYAESSSGPNEPILEKIEEALMFPPVGSLLFEIKIKIGTSTCAKGQKENCELKADGESKPCTVQVFLENKKSRVELKCN